MTGSPDLAEICRRLWEKDPFLWKADPAGHKELADRLGWLESPEWAEGNAAQLRSFSEQAKADGIGQVVLLGMGGSSLAPEVFAKVFGPAPGFPALTVLDTVDPASVLEARGRLDPRGTLFLVSSKSGSTIETSTLYEYFRAAMDEALGDEAGRHFAAITDPGSSLESLAKKAGFRAVFHGLPDVGGRYSALTAFGMVPAALLGIDVAALAREARAAAQRCRPPLAAGEPAGELGRLMASGRPGQAPLKLAVFLPPEASSLGDWIEQLVAESTGKEGRGVLPVLKGGAGPQGRLPPDAAAVTVSAAPGNKHWVASEMFRWMFATAVAGALMRINPFDQPDVESAKDITRRLLGGPSGEAALPDPPEATVAQGAAAPEGVRRHLAGIAPPQYVALLAYTPIGAAVKDSLERLKRAVERLARPAAVTSGIGPRYLHSTGQLHKGGPPNGVFIQLVSDDARDAPVPGRPYSLGTLKRAQAAGDLAALCARGRRVLKIRLGTDPAAAMDSLADSLS